MKYALPYRKGKVSANHIEIYFEAFGNPKDPTVLLIAGMDAQCTLWPSFFYQPIVEAGYHLVRFDNRDCGLSTWIRDWNQNCRYTIEDMAADTVGLLDGLNIEKVHLVGASMGGMIAQRMAIGTPHRIHTLTSISSSGFAGDPDPALQEKKNAVKSSLVYGELLAQYPNYLKDDQETIEFRVNALKLLTGSRFPFDEELQREIETHNILERKGFNPLASIHQFAAIIASGSRLDELPRITTPTLVIHGTEDPLLPPGHAEKYAQRIPNARLVWMEGVGHELPKGIMGLVHQEILALFTQSSP